MVVGGTCISVTWVPEGHRRTVPCLQAQRLVGLLQNSVQHQEFIRTLLVELGCHANCWLAPIVCKMCVAKPLKQSK